MTRSAPCTASGSPTWTAISSAPDLVVAPHRASPNPVPPAAPAPGAALIEAASGRCSARRRALLRAEDPRGAALAEERAAHIRQQHDASSGKRRQAAEVRSLDRAETC